MTGIQLTLTYLTLLFGARVLAWFALPYQVKRILGGFANSIKVSMIQFFRRRGTQVLRTSNNNNNYHIDLLHGRCMSTKKINVIYHCVII